jgi:hypothetical protein
LSGTENQISSQSIPRPQIDLSFLDVPTSRPREATGDIIEKVCFSLVICGTDDRHYVGYSFVDRDFEDPDEKLDGSLFDYQGPHEDPIASDCGEGVINANHPIWDPRTYFLSVVDLRMTKTLKEWRGLARRIIRKIDHYVGLLRDFVSERCYRKSGNANKLQERCHSSTLWSPGRNSNVQNTKEMFDWNKKVMDLLEELLHILSESITSWDVFCSNSGDIGYFSNVTSSPPAQNRVMQSLRSIEAQFESLRTIQRQLLSYKERRQRSMDSVSYALSYFSTKGRQT